MPNAAFYSLRAGFPLDVKDRELNNLLRYMPGYEACQMNWRSGQPQGFALFSTSAAARAAVDVITGALFDDEFALRAELAHKCVAAHCSLLDPGALVQLDGGLVTCVVAALLGYGSKRQASLVAWLASDSANIHTSSLRGVPGDPLGTATAVKVELPWSPASGAGRHKQCAQLPRLSLAGAAQEHVRQGRP